jgi:branched-chain amino acid transport system substrate-binding protein
MSVKLARLPLLITSLSLLLGACNLRFDFTECNSDADCTPFEGRGQLLTCQDNTCAIAEGVECRQDADCPAMRPSCDATNRCIASQVQPDMMSEMGPGTDMPEDMPPSGCTKHSDCMMQGSQDDPFFCGAAGQCVSFRSEDCESVFVDSVSRQTPEAYDRLVFIGSLLPLIEPFGSSIGVPLKNAVELAIRELNGAGGLPGGARIAWVSCDSKGNAQVATRAAGHLASIVRVPAILGPLFSEEVIAVASAVTVPRDIFLLTPTATSPEIGNLNSAQKTLVWRNIASDIFQGAAFLKRLQDIAVPRVLILYKDDKYGDDLQRQITPRLSQRLGMNNVRLAKFDNPITIPNTTERRQKYGMIVTRSMMSFGATPPDTVVIIGTSEGAEIAGAYYGYVAAAQITPAKIIFSHGAVPVMNLVADSVAMNMALKPGVDSGALLEGVAPDIFDPTTTAYQNFSFIYNTTFSGTEPSLASTTSFDGAMTIMLGMSTIPMGEPITGPKIAQGISLLVNKAASARRITFLVDQAYVSAARNAVASGEAIDIVGVSGELDYDVMRGEVYSRSIGWVPVLNPGTGRYTIGPRRVLVFTNPPATDGMWTELP